MVEYAPFRNNVDPVQAEEFLKAQRKYTLNLINSFIERHPDEKGEEGELVFPDFGIPVDMYFRPLVGLKKQAWKSVRGQLAVAVNTTKGEQTITVAMMPSDTGVFLRCPLFAHDQVIENGSTTPPNLMERFTGLIAEIDVTNNTSYMVAVDKNGNKVPVAERPGIEPGVPEAADLFVNACMQAVHAKTPVPPEG